MIRHSHLGLHSYDSNGLMLSTGYSLCIANHLTASILSRGAPVPQEFFELKILAKNPVWLGIDMLIYHWTSLAKNLNGAKSFDDYTVVIVSGNTKQWRCSFRYTMGR